nr:hypothetical protein GCM10017745_03760 [Saccharothrix mutabilis subsp. capreolus]
MKSAKNMITIGTAMTNQAVMMAPILAHPPGTRVRGGHYGVSSPLSYEVDVRPAPPVASLLRLPIDYPRFRLANQMVHPRRRLRPSSARVAFNAWRRATR